MSRVLPARLTPTRLVPYRWSGGAFAVAGPPVDLVESPTRVRRMHRVGTAGETLSIVGEQLLGRGGEVQDLTGATVTLTVDPPDGGTAVIAAASCTVDAQADTVSFSGTVPSPEGVYRYQYKLRTSDGRTLYFPDGTYGTLTVIPALS